MRRTAMGSVLLALSVAAFACGGDGHPNAAAAGDGGAYAGPPPGYVRFTTQPVTVPPGTSAQWFEWVQAPFDHDVDVVDIQGKQSVGGHHAVLYSTTDIQPVGTVKVWQDANVVTAHFLGGIGGEAGGGALKLPEGAVFRLRAGQALALQVHYLNTTARPLQGTSQLDVKFGSPSATDRLASLLTNTAFTFQIPAQGKGHVDVSCTIVQDASVIMFTNHMHEWGTSVTTQLVDSSGTQTTLKSDPAWNPEWTTNPDYSKLTVAAPLVLKAGDTIKTSCDWTNTTTQALAFPAEMCVFVSFYLGNSDLGCVDNGKIATQP